MQQQSVVHTNAMAEAMAPIVLEAAEVEAMRDTADYVFAKFDGVEFQQVRNRLSATATPVMQALFALRLEAAKCRPTCT